VEILFSAYGRPITLEPNSLSAAAFPCLA
jgi:hypothetical protein